MYILLNKMSAAYALLLFSLTVIIGIACQIQLTVVFIRAFGIFAIARILGWILVYILFFEKE